MTDMQLYNQVCLTILYSSDSQNCQSYRVAAHANLVIDVRNPCGEKHVAKNGSHVIRHTINKNQANNNVIHNLHTQTPGVHQGGPSNQSGCGNDNGKWPNGIRHRGTGCNQEGECVEQCPAPLVLRIWEALFV